MLLKIVTNDTFQDIPIKEGEMFLLPGTLTSIYTSPDAQANAS